MINIQNMNKSEIADLIKQNAENVSFDLIECSNELREKYYGKDVYLRGLVEFTNYCKNGCFYCGLQNTNKDVKRYRLSKDEILQCCETGYKYGLRTFVLQGGEDLFFDDKLIQDIVYSIKNKFPECAVTLSIGEKNKESYKRFFDAGADRYLLRHETASKKLYSKIHPQNMNFDNRIRCLHNLKEIGFQTGAGFMVGLPYQTFDDLAEDLLFIKQLEPHMVGIGPFIPQNQTVFADRQKGSLNLTLTMLVLTRLLLPNVLLPSTTALATLSKNGRKLGLDCGCNVVMPNITPPEARKNYLLYDNKINYGNETLEGINMLKDEIINSGYFPVVSRGDFKNI